MLLRLQTRLLQDRKGPVPRNDRLPQGLVPENSDKACLQRHDGEGSQALPDSLHRLPSDSLHDDEAGSLLQDDLRQGRLHTTGSLHDLHDDSPDLHETGSLHDLHDDRTLHYASGSLYDLHDGQADLHSQGAVHDLHDGQADLYPQGAVHDLHDGQEDLHPQGAVHDLRKGLLHPYGDEKTLRTA